MLHRRNLGAAIALVSATLGVGGAIGFAVGQSLLLASLRLIPSGLVMFFISGTAAKLSEVWHIVVIATFVGLGIGFAYAAMPTLPAFQAAFLMGAGVALAGVIVEMTPQASPCTDACTLNRASVPGASTHGSGQRGR